MLYIPGSNLLNAQYPIDAAPRRRGSDPAFSKALGHPPFRPAPLLHNVDGIGEIIQQRDC